MIDEIYDRQFQAHRSALNSSVLDLVSTFGAAIANAFEVLNRIEYQTPWTIPAKRSKCGSR